MFGAHLAQCSRSLASSSSARAASLHTSAVLGAVSARARRTQQTLKSNIQRRKELEQQAQQKRPHVVLGHKPGDEAKWYNCDLAKVIVTEEDIRATPMPDVGVQQLPTYFNYGVGEEEKELLFEVLPALSTEAAVLAQKQGLVAKKKKQNYALSAGKQVAHQNQNAWDAQSSTKSPEDPNTQAIDAATLIKAEANAAAVESQKFKVFARLVDLRNANAEGIAYENRRRIIAAFSEPDNPNDPGRPEVQGTSNEQYPALATYEIRNVWEHLNRAKKDIASRRSLRKLVHHRAKILRYLKGVDEDRYDRAIPCAHPKQTALRSTLSQARSTLRPELCTMTAVSSAPAAMVDFPSSGQDLHPSTSLDLHYQRPTYLPFRRISLPSAPNLQHRQSIVSTASFDSLPEDRAVVPVTPVVIRNAVRGPRQRPSSTDVARRVRRKESRLVDPQKEAKRRKVIAEFYETEKSYLDGLELIHSHFLTPIIKSLDTPQPLLDRAELTSIFSNFIDIWNLHRSFYVSLTAFLNSSASLRPNELPPPLSPVLLAHFPYLSLYTPFVSSFSDALASYASLLKNNSAFAAFIAQQEADPRCGKLKFRDWLLTIVQRCPRYLLLLKDMIECTNAEDPEYTSLTAVHTLVSKITMSLNTSLHTHAQTLALLALQRNTLNLPFQLITPGRTFLKRASLLQLEGSAPKEREFLLFSDCLIWLASADGDFFSDKWSAFSSPSNSNGSAGGGAGGGILDRTRSRNDAESEAVKRRQSLLQLRFSGSPKKKTRQGSNAVDDRWVYKGHVELVDLEVVVSAPAANTPERGFELLSPHQSFAIYAATDDERDEWITAIRNAKSSLLVSLSVMQLNSTLTSSAATNHLRRTLHALPYAPDDTSKPRRDGELHAVRPDVRLAEAQAPLPTMRALRVRWLLEQGTSAAIEPPIMSSWRTC
ncbi:hypothetical protein BN946_scf185022.g5 [Trametes cinnabarina]|uniref:DH domain-containing protein n=1 Tax=Pycnoporus cinnabarinus TaxID=5643 RepID=A0A060SKF3_PYCCI|nr:hypothetical protein BN946_scf185022.g5 [Trametes cinnabarina]